MNGECKSFRLNEPMSWQEFKAMPDDIKITYIKLLRQKFSCPDSKIGEMMGADKNQISRMFKKLGLNQGKTKKKVNWDKEGFYAWWHGVEELPTPVIEEEPIQEPVITSEEPEEFVEEDLPFDIVPVEESDPDLDEMRMENSLLNAQVDALQKANDALMASHESDCHALEKWRITCCEYEEKVKILEAQMEVVRMIFGGANR